MILRSISLLFMLALTGGAFAQAALTVELVLNHPEAGGTIRLVLCPNEASYAAEKGCLLKEAAASSAMVRVLFPDVPPGTYAVKVFHDVNENGTLDVNWLGIPKEPYGFSNDAMGTFGPPSFEQASFKVGAGAATVRIRMKG